MSENNKDEIPSSIWNLTKFKYLNLKLNYIDGKIPEDIYKLIKLYFLDIINNANINVYVP